MGSPEWFPSIYVWSGIWQFTGFSAVIYLAALSTVDPSLHEAAVVDGANRLQRIWHIDLQTILPTAMTLLILIQMNVAKKALLQIRSIKPLRSDHTYIYKVSPAAEFCPIHMGAIGLFNSLVGLILLIIATKFPRINGNWALVG
jgi:multiple sugar transport system permease protein/putative aldouronate transport system permease protein